MDIQVAVIIQHKRIDRGEFFTLIVNLIKADASLLNPHSHHILKAYATPPTPHSRTKAHRTLQPTLFQPITHCISHFTHFINGMQLVQFFPRDISCWPLE
jgi:hypothetical protein